MTSFRALLKLIGGGIIVLTFAFGQTFGVCLARWFPRASLRYANRVTSLGCRAFLRHWGIRVTLRNAHHIAPRRTYLYAVNHLSYLDILVHASLFPSTFITSREMHGTLFLGHICRFAQCFFVDRKNRRRLAQEIRAVGALLESGVPVTLFPEGAAGDGAGVQPFRSPLFKACAASGTPVLPLTLNYRTLDSVPVGPGTGTTSAGTGAWSSSPTSGGCSTTAASRWTSSCPRPSSRVTTGVWQRRLAKPSRVPVFPSSRERSSARGQFRGSMKGLDMIQICTLCCLAAARSGRDQETWRPGESQCEQPGSRWESNMSSREFVRKLQ